MDLCLCPAELYLLHANLHLCPAESYLLPEDSYFLHVDLGLSPAESYLLHADLYLCPAELYLLPAEFKSVHTSDSVKVSSLFHQVSHQQEYFSTIDRSLLHCSTMIHKGRKLFA